MEQVIIAALCGVAIGVLSGMLGVGGGSLMVPLFRLIFGLEALAATGTSLFTMIFTSIAGSISHIRGKRCLVGLGLLAGACGAVMSPLGVRLANMSPAWLVMLCTALVIAYSAITMIRKGLALDKNAPETVPVTTEELPKLTPRQYAIGALAGLAAGFAGGYVGLGGGFLMVPIFMTGIGLSMKIASPTSLLAIAILSASGAYTQWTLGNVEVLMGLAMAAGSIPGAILGAKALRYAPERTLRLCFGFFLLILAVMLAVNEFMA